MTPRVRAVGFVVVVASLLAGCVDFFLAPEPGDDPVALFESVWHEYDAYYSYFIHKGIDWDSVYDVYRPQVEAGMTDRALADLLGAMITGLEDSHADLLTPFGEYGYVGWYEPYRENYHAEAVESYVYRRPPSEGGSLGITRGAGVSYGWLTDRIAYARIPGFGDPAIRDGFGEALAALAGADGLIIDIRSNGGGSDLNSDAVVGRLVERRLLAGYYAYRNGPEHDDFTERFQRWNQPVGEAPFLGPLAVLTNRRVVSTAETFLLAVRAMRDRRYVVTVGDTTGGGFGNPLWRELSNGWTFRVPRWNEWDIDGRNFEGIGVPPLVPVQFTDQDVADRRDPILETAVAELEARLP